jgi:flagellar biosynthesis protein
MTDKDEDPQSGEQKISVALQYDGKGDLPRVTAKGSGDVAERIVEAARSAGVPVEHNAPLAKALSKLELEQAIPKELYRAVAEVIGFILRKSGQTQQPARPQPR